MSDPAEQGTARNARKPLDDDRTKAILGAAIEVHTTLGAGYLEKVYHLALEVELARAAVPFRSEVEMPIWYKGRLLGATYRADVVAYGDILVELKAQRSVGVAEHAQVINYLKAGRLPVGLLLNFGEPTLNIKRFVGPEHFRPRVP